jgi:hypothetical protein
VPIPLLRSSIEIVDSTSLQSFRSDAARRSSPPALGLSGAGPMAQQCTQNRTPGIHCRVGGGIAPAFPWHRRPARHCLPAPLSDPGAVPPACLGANRTAAFPSLHWVGFGLVARTYLMSTIIHYSEFNDAACVLALPLLRTPRFPGRTSLRLPTRWLAFGRVGFEDFRPLTHWVTLMSFKGNHPCSLVPDLSRHEHPV